MFVTDVNDENFEQEVLNSEVLSFVDFWADWCQPCLRLNPVIDDLAKEYQGRINFFKVNVDENSQIANEYGIRSVPYMLLIKDGEAIDVLVGSHSKPQIEYFLTQQIA